MIGPTKLVVGGGHGATFHTGIPVHIRDVSVIDDIDVVDGGVVYARVVSIAAPAKASAPPRIETFKRSQCYPADSAATKPDAEAAPSKETDDCRTPGVRYVNRPRKPAPTMSGLYQRSAH